MFKLNLLPKRLVFMGNPDGPKPTPEAADAAPKPRETVAPDVEKALKEYSQLRQRALDKADSFIKSTDPKISLKVKVQANAFKTKILSDTIDPSILDPKKQNAKNIRDMMTDLRELVTDMSIRISDPEAATRRGGERLQAAERANPSMQATYLAESMAKRIEKSVAETGRLDLMDLQLQVKALSDFMDQNPQVLNKEQAWSVNLIVADKPLKISYYKGVSDAPGAISLEYSTDDTKSVNAVFELDGRVKTKNSTFETALAANIPRLPRQPGVPMTPKVRTRTAVAGPAPEIEGPEPKVEAKVEVKPEFELVFGSELDKVKQYFRRIEGAAIMNNAPSGQRTKVAIGGLDYFVTFGGEPGTQRKIDRVEKPSS